MSFLNANRLRISQYFNNLVSEIDLKTELALIYYKNDQALTSKINAKRETFLKEIRECEAFNVEALLESSKRTRKLSRMSSYSKSSVLLSQLHSYRRIRGRDLKIIILKKFVRLSVYLSVCLSVCLSVRLL